MKRNNCFNKLLLFALLLVLTAKSKAQSEMGVAGIPGQPVNSIHLRNSIIEAERSPLNDVPKGPIIENLQGLKNRKAEPKFIVPEVTPEQKKRTPVYHVPSGSSSITEPVSESSNKLAGGQLPSYVFNGNFQNGSIPSDAQGAAGPNHLIVLANGDARILRKSNGAVISAVTLNAFFGWSGTFDPRIYYDPYYGKWVALALKGASNTCAAVDSKFRLLISNNSDPTAGWYFYEIDFDAANAAWLDFGLLGFSANWICISGNSYCGTPQPSIFAFDKAVAYTGATVNYWLWNGDGVLAPAFTYDPGQSTLYMVRNWNGNSGGVGYDRIYTITGAVSSPVLTAGSFVATSTAWQDFAGAGASFPQQYGSTSTFSFVNAHGSNLSSNCVYRNGSLWWAQPVFLPATGTVNRMSTLWWQVDAASATVQQLGLLDDASGVVSTMYPSITANSANDAVLSCCQASPNYYQSAAYYWHNSVDAAGSLNGNFYASGGNIDTSTRTGDYGETFVDPLDDNSVWAINQISSSTANYFQTVGVLIPYYYGCYTNVSFGNYVWYGNTKNEASGTLSSQEMISGSSIVDYDAGVEVVLQPGFAAYDGSTFHAYIGGCGGARMMGSSSKAYPEASNNNQQILQNLKLSGHSFQLFPNPTMERVTLNYTLEENEINAELLLFDANMKLVKEIPLKAGGSKYLNTSEIDLSGLNSGVYICSYKTSAKNEVSRLVIMK